MNQSPPKRIKHVGLDVHATAHDVAVAESGTEEVRYHGEIAGTLEAVDRMLRKLGTEGVELRVCYEAGPTGYGLARHLASRGIACGVVAPGLIPRKSGERVKTNRLDAQRLARLARAGELTFVHVPDAGDEAIRDLVRARMAAMEDLRRQRQRLLGLLLRQGRRYPGTAGNWTRAHRAYLAGLVWEHGEHAFLCQEMLQAVDTEQARVDRFAAALESRLAGWRWAAVVAALRCLRGIDTVSAMTLVAEVGDFSRFASPEQLSAYLGLVPGEASTGNRRIQGAITKTGNGACRRTLVEAAHHYRRAPAVGLKLRGRQEGQPEAVVAHAWRAQVRLCGRFEHLMGQHKKTVVVVTAVARELAGFVWAVAMRAMGKNLPERRHREAPRVPAGATGSGTPEAKGPRIYVLKKVEGAEAAVMREKPARRRVARESGPQA
jgi:transposase